VVLSDNTRPDAVVGHGRRPGRRDAHAARWRACSRCGPAAHRPAGRRPCRPAPSSSTGVAERSKRPSWPCSSPCQAVIAPCCPSGRLLATLAIRQTMLEARNAAIPLRLPAVWARIGRPARAESLALGQPDPDRRRRSMTELVRGLGAAGEFDRAQEIAASAKPHQGASMLADLVHLAAAAGDRERAAALAELAERTVRQGREAETPQWLPDNLSRALAATADDPLDWLSQRVIDPRPWLREVSERSGLGGRGRARPSARERDRFRHCRTRRGRQPRPRSSPGWSPPASWTRPRTRRRPSRTRTSGPAR